MMIRQGEAGRRLQADEYPKSAAGDLDRLRDALVNLFEEAGIYRLLDWLSRKLPR